MSKGIHKARKITKSPLGIRSSLGTGTYAGDGIFHDTVDEEMEESYTDFTQHVILSVDRIKSSAELEKLSGTVNKYSIDDLPEEERKKYVKKD